MGRNRARDLGAVRSARLCRCECGRVGRGADRGLSVRAVAPGDVGQSRRRVPDAEIRDAADQGGWRGGAIVVGVVDLRREGRAWCRGLRRFEGRGRAAGEGRGQGRRAGSYSRECGVAGRGRDADLARDAVLSGFGRRARVGGCGLCGVGKDGDAAWTVWRADEIAAQIVHLLSDESALSPARRSLSTVDTRYESAAPGANRDRTGRRHRACAVVAAGRRARHNTGGTTRDFRPDAPAVPDRPKRVDAGGRTPRRSSAISTTTFSCCRGRRRIARAMTGVGATTICSVAAGGRSGSCCMVCGRNTSAAIRRIVRRMNRASSRTICWQRCSAISPSAKLVQHEWAKHGTCSGLSQRDYFAKAAKAFGDVAVPLSYFKPTEVVTTTPDEVRAALSQVQSGVGRRIRVARRAGATSWPRFGFASTSNSRRARARRCEHKSLRRPSRADARGARRLAALSSIVEVIATISMRILQR